MPGQLGPNWNGWARFSNSYRESVAEVISKRKKIKKPRAKKRPKQKVL